VRIGVRWLLGDPDGLDGPGLVRLVRHGDPPAQVAAARRLGILAEREAADALVGALGHAVPGVRRTAAMALGRRGDPTDAAALRAALASERCTTPLIAMAAGWVRCGGDLTDAAEQVGLHGDAAQKTVGGWRSPSAAAGFGARTLQRELLQLLDPFAVGDEPPWAEVQVQPVDALVARLDALARRDPHGGHGRQALEYLAALEPPDLVPRLELVRRDAGRRTDNSALLALGRCGDPLAADLLLADLDRIDVDPGRGFAYRRLSAIGLGRLGLPHVAPRILRALEVEARDHEGRPGAGLGIQYPVRTNLIWALGEVQAARAAKVLVTYLGNMSGSALGGFYLPAMGALVKIGQAAVPALERATRRGSSDERAHAEAVLEAIRG